MFRIRVGLQNILALNVDALEAAIHCRIEHIGDTQPRLVVEFHAPEFLEDVARRIV
ncbi:hypothetical protein D3C80_2198280 [compost metagenome]